jgi:hypothetical protein
MDRTNALLVPPHPFSPLPRDGLWKSSSWVPERTAVKLTPAMIDAVLSTTKGPKKLIQAWEMARNPPSPFEYMLEKKMNYHTLVEKYKSL